MNNLVTKLKTWNRDRLNSRRDTKFNTVLSNAFDRAPLGLDQLKRIASDSCKVHLVAEGRRKLAVYSTYFGIFNNKTLSPLSVSASFDHYFVSNNEKILYAVERCGWKPIFLDLEVSPNRILSAQQAKVPKALPHIFQGLNSYDYLLYVDDKIDFNVHAISTLIDAMGRGDSSLMIRIHPSLRGNILNEFAAAMIQPRYQAQRDQTVEYIDRQLKNGMQLKVDDLYWTSAILRNTSHPDTILINEMWYKNIMDCGIECQISFDFIAQQFHSIAVMPADPVYFKRA